jgi:ArsR family transcriptional regulator, virulence genes transcriptional regulator
MCCIIFLKHRIYENMKIKTEIMSQAADVAVELLQSLGNRSRLMIMCQLLEGEKSVGQLAEFLQARESTVSQHLALLRKDRLVTTRRDGQTIFYSISSDPARRIIELLYEIYCPQP